MLIQWFGLDFVKLQTKDATLALDPFPASSGVKPPRFSADLLLLSRTDSTDPSAILGSPYVIDHPGEFEVKGAFVYGVGIGSGKDARTLFVVEAEGISVALLPGLTRPLEGSEIERFEGADILCLPVGGHGVLDAEGAATVVSQLEPRVVIPIHYKLPGFKVSLDGVSTFAREIGVKESERMDKLRIVKKDLPQEETRVYLVQSA
jgi:hypothetical protein